MKVKLYVYKCPWEKGLTVTSNDYDHYGPLIKVVTVDLPDDIMPSDEEYKRLLYIHKLSEAEKEVAIKRDELTKAEEVVKNMMAIEHKL